MNYEPLTPNFIAFVLTTLFAYLIYLLLRFLFKLKYFTIVGKIIRFKIDKVNINLSENSLLKEAVYVDRYVVVLKDLQGHISHIHIESEDFIFLRKEWIQNKKIKVFFNYSKCILFGKDLIDYSIDSNLISHLDKEIPSQIATV